MQKSFIVFFLWRTKHVTISISMDHAGLERNAAVRGARPPDVKMKFVLKQKGSRHIVTSYYPTHLRWKTFLLRSPVLSGKKHGLTSQNKHAWHTIQLGNLWLATFGAASMATLARSMQHLASNIWLAMFGWQHLAGNIWGNLAAVSLLFVATVSHRQEHRPVMLW